MKKILLFSLFISPFLHSQNLETKEINAPMSKGNQPGIEIVIPYVTEDNVEDAIKKVTKKFKGDKEKIKRSNEFYLDDAKIKELSDNTIDIHFIMIKETNGLKLNVFYNLGGVFLSSNYDSKKFQYAEDLVTRIAIQASEIRIDDIIKDESNKLEDLVDDKEDFEKDIQKAKKDIQKAKDEIAENEKNIIAYEKSIEAKNKEIDKQKMKLSKLHNQKKSIK